MSTKQILKTLDSFSTACMVATPAGMILLALYHIATGPVGEKIVNAIILTFNL